MKASDELFLLVKSLSKNEKGYFKKNSFEGKYIKVFEEIEKMARKNDPYDERRIKNKFPGIGLTYAKRYLYFSILTSLFDYFRNESETIEILQMAGFAEILFKKGFLKQCIKMTTKAKDIAYQNSLYQLLPALISIEKSVFTSSVGESEFNRDHKKNFEEEKKVYSILQNLSEYKFYSDTLVTIIAKGDIFRNKSDKKKADDVIGLPLFANEKYAICKDSKILFHHTLATYYFSVFDHARSMKHVKALLTLMDKGKLSGTKNIYRYLITVQNYVYLCIFNGKPKEAKMYLDKIPDILHNKEMLPDSLRYMLVARNFILTIHTLQMEKKFDECQVYINQNLDNIELTETEINPELQNILRLYVSTSCFISVDLDGSLHWLNKILNSTETESRSDIFCAAKIFNMILHYELGNIEHLEYVFKSTYRFLARRKKIFRFESVILKMFRKLPAVKTDSEFIELLDITRSELKKIFEDPYERQVLNYFDFLSWITSKVEKVTFREYLLSSN